MLNSANRNMTKHSAYFSSWLHAVLASCYIDLKHTHMLEVKAEKSVSDEQSTYYYLRKCDILSCAYTGYLLNL